MSQVIPENTVAPLPSRTYGYWTSQGGRATAIRAFRDYARGLKRPDTIVRISNFRFIAHVGVLGCACETPDTYGWTAEFHIATMVRP